MSSNIIKKCIEELTKDQPRLDYLRGLLEALDDRTKEVPAYTPIYPNLPPNYPIPTVISDFSGGMPPRPLIVPAASPDLIAKLKGGATVEEVQVPLNATPKETT